MTAPRPTADTPDTSPAEAARVPRVSMTDDPKATDDLQKLYEWLREPDWADQFGQEQVLDWLNRRPCQTPLRAKATIADLRRQLADAERAGMEVLPEEPSREVWAAMADAFVAAHHEHGRQTTIAPDFVTGPIYAAIRAAMPTAAKDEVRHG